MAFSRCSLRHLGLRLCFQWEKHSKGNRSKQRETSPQNSQSQSPWCLMCFQLQSCPPPGPVLNCLLLFHHPVRHCSSFRDDPKTLHTSISTLKLTDQAGELLGFPGFRFHHQHQYEVVLLSPLNFQASPFVCPSIPFTYSLSYSTGTCCVEGIKC